MWVAGAQSGVSPRFTGAYSGIPLWLGASPISGRWPRGKLSHTRFVARSPDARHAPPAGRTTRKRFSGEIPTAAGALRNGDEQSESRMLPRAATVHSKLLPRQLPFFSAGRHNNAAVGGSDAMRVAEGRRKRENCMRQRSRQTAPTERPRRRRSTAVACYQ
jgi:hypothetical protein